MSRHYMIEYRIGPNTTKITKLIPPITIASQQIKSTDDIHIEWKEISGIELTMINKGEPCVIDIHNQDSDYTIRLNKGHVMGYSSIVPEWWYKCYCGKTDIRFIDESS